MVCLARWWLNNNGAFASLGVVCVGLVGLLSGLVVAL